MEKLLKLKKDLIGRFEKYELLAIEDQLKHLDNAIMVSKDIAKTQKSINTMRKELVRCMSY